MSESGLLSTSLNGDNEGSACIVSKPAFSTDENETTCKNTEKVLKMEDNIREIEQRIDNPFAKGGNYNSEPALRGKRVQVHDTGTTLLNRANN